MSEFESFDDNKARFFEIPQEIKSKNEPKPEWDDNKARFFEVPKEILEENESRAALGVGGTADKAAVDKAYEEKVKEFTQNKKAGLEGQGPLVAEDELEALQKARDFLSKTSPEDVA